MNEDRTDQTNGNKSKNMPPVIRNCVLPIAGAIAAIALAVITFFTLIVMYRGNEITNTANLLYIHSSIQIREDALISINEELGMANLFYTNPKERDEKVFELTSKRREAIYALAKIYEFACQQYRDNKIDREAFENFYSDRLINIFDDYDILDRNKYPAIKGVIGKWQ